MATASFTQAIRGASGNLGMQRLRMFAVRTEAWARIGLRVETLKRHRRESRLTGCCLRRDA